jgi:hypothetical protein
MSEGSACPTRTSVRSSLADTSRTTSLTNTQSGFPLTDREPFADDGAWLRFIHRRDCGIGHCRWSGWPAINAAERDSIGASALLPNTIPMSRCPICGICSRNAHAGTPRGCHAGSITLTCPFRKSHPAWESHRRIESSHDRGRCLRSCIRSQCLSSTSSSRRAGLKPRTCSFAINSASP